MKVKDSSPACDRRLVSALRALAAVYTVILMCGCTATPAARFADRAESLGFQAGTVPGDQFEHRTFAAGSRSGAGETLHVYFGSDGSPFVGRSRIARDPTPRRPLTLELMSRDPFPAVHVGRPCYHAVSDGCDPALWTTARYSDAVVSSMAAATGHLIELYAPATVVLVGYSGGGALAALVAERLPRVNAVVTVAANLDIDAWTQRHGYSPLTGSINPAGLIGGRAGLMHLHLAGSEDDNVPPESQRRALTRLPPSSGRTVEGFDHRCCWASLWPQPLAEIEARLELLRSRPRRGRPPPVSAPGSMPDGYPESHPPP